MLAQDRHEGSENGGRQSAPRKSSRHPTKFMFIDSSNGGVNAKPDRVVRSFVMKSARTRRKWSTRPKSPKEQSLVDSNPTPLEQLSDYTIAPCNTAAVTNLWSPQGFRKDSLWEDIALAPPASSTDGGNFTASSENKRGSSPVSGHTSPFSEYSHTENAYAWHTSSTYRDGFEVRFMKSLDCLPVYLDARSQRLLQQCKHICVIIPCTY
jgi:hypothetical protein